MVTVQTWVADSRARRGMRHRLATIVGLAVCAVLAGARSFTAIAEWATDADERTRAELGVTGVVPCESTIQRTLQSLGRRCLRRLGWRMGAAADRAAAGRAQTGGGDGKT